MMPHQSPPLPPVPIPPSTSTPVGDVVTQPNESDDDFLGIAFVKHPDDEGMGYEVSTCPACYALVTRRGWDKHKDWHRRAERPKLPTRYKGAAGGAS